MAKDKKETAKAKEIVETPEKPEAKPDVSFVGAPAGTKAVAATLDELKQYEAEGRLVGWDGKLALIKQ